MINFQKLRKIKEIKTIVKKLRGYQLSIVN